MSNAMFFFPMAVICVMDVRQKVVERFSVGVCGDFVMNAMVMQAGLVPIVESLLGWQEMETSLFFCGAGVWVRMWNCRSYIVHLTRNQVNTCKAVIGNRPVPVQV